MDKTIEELFEEKLRVTLNLIRTNSTSDDVLKVTQGVRNLVDAKNSLEIKEAQQKPKKQGASASE